MALILAEKATLNAIKKYGQDVGSREAAIERLIAGDGVFVFHEQSAEPFRVTASADLDNFVEDAILVVAAEYLPQAEDAPAPRRCAHLSQTLTQPCLDAIRSALTVKGLCSYVC